MNKLLAKKLAEVTAFAEVSADTYSKGEEALHRVLDRDYVRAIYEVNTETAKRLHECVIGEEHESLYREYTQKTLTKIKKMREIYLEDNWDEADEVIEWLGFIEGSASVHWSLVETLANESDMDDITHIAKKMKEYHTELIGKLEDAIKKSE